MIPDDQIRFVLTIIASIPLGLAFRYLHSSQLRLYYSLAMGFLLQYYVYKNEIFITYVLHVIMYTVVLKKGRKCGALVTGLSIGMLSAYHIYRMIVDYGGWSLDVSTIMMGNVCQYSLFAFSYQDGQFPDDKLKTKDQINQKIQKIPTIIQFISYMNFLPICILGTPISYKLFIRFIGQQNQFKNIPIQGILSKMLSDFKIILFALVLYLFGMLYIPLKRLSQESFLQQNLIYISIYTAISITLVRFKYYFGWKLAMLPVHMAGASYQPEKQHDPFLGIQTCDPWAVETTVHLPVKVNNWNMAVQQWLRKCIYERLNTSKQVGKFLTILFSAFWHGFYGGYYFTFLLWFTQIYIANLVFKISKNENHMLTKLYKRFEPASKYIILIFWNWMFSFNGIYFMVLSVKICMNILYRIYFSTPIFLILIIAVIMMMPKGKRQKKQENKNN